MKPTKNIQRSFITLAAALDARLTQFAAVDLGKSYGDVSCGPSLGSSMSYPTLYVSGREDSKLSDIPKSGKATVEYRVRSKSTNYREDGTETHSSDIEIKSIDPVNLEAIVARHEFARGDVLTRHLGKWAERQPKSLRKLAGQAIKEPLVKGVLKNDAELVKKGMNWDGMSVDDAKKALPYMRKNTADQVRAERKVGILKKRYRNVDELVKDQKIARDIVYDKSTNLEAILTRYNFADRVRNPAGQFAPGTEVSSQDMADAYGTKKKKAALLVGGGAAALTAAVAGRKAAPALMQGAGRVLRSAVGG